MPVTKDCFLERRGFLSKNNIIKDSLSDIKYLGSLTRFFNNRSSNRSDKLFEVSSLRSCKSILRSPASAMLS